MKKLASLAAVLALAGCASGTFTQDYTPGADFTAFETYAWMPNQATPEGTSALVDQRIKRAIEGTLQARGMRAALPEDADFLVGYQLVMDDRVDYQTVNDYWGPRWRYGRMYGPTYVTSRTTAYEYTYGTLIIDFFDTETQELVWRGVGEGRINETNDPAEKQQRANEGVARILEQFPPRG